MLQRETASTKRKHTTGRDVPAKVTSFRSLKRHQRLPMSTAATDYHASQRQLSVLLGVSRVTIREWTRRGYIPKPQLIGNRVLYSLRDVSAAVETNKLRIKPPKPLPQL